ncbi:nuclear transport factor 2 family protein [Streptomyces kaniharaensis]|uniref:nuclear transport factor 2 family protein n=1 Tax=Streptomyces kaniharaensis TaxID=212423 RepID=UPI002DDD75E5|nr:nuclear transport factor 2 family protein [Streptomyces kaniharaensis]
MVTLEEPITRERAIGIVRQLAAAKNHQDAQAAAAIYHPEAVLESPTLGSRHEGPAITKVLENWFAFAPDYQVDLDGYALDGRTLCCWGYISLTPAFTVGGAVPNGESARVNAFILFRFREGKVLWESFHFDVAALARQCGVAATDLVGES